MAKIDRYNGNVVAFGSEAEGTERTVFGDTTQSDSLDQNLNSFYKRGFGIVDVNEAPTKQDFNAVNFTNSQLIAYLHQAGIAEWNTNQEYHSGSLANVNGIVYKSKTDNNVGNDPRTDTTNWITSEPNQIQLLSTYDNGTRTDAEILTAATSAMNTLGKSLIIDKPVDLGGATVDCLGVGLVWLDRSNKIVSGNLINYGELLTPNQFNTIDDLRDYSALVENEVVQVSGYSASGDGGQGNFVFDSSDLSTEVATDTKSGIYVAPNSDLTGASGAWVRQLRSVVDIRVFGPTGDGVTNDYESFASAATWLSGSSGRRLILEKGKTYYLNYTGSLFLNGIIGNGANIIIEEGGFLQYSRGLDDDNIFIQDLNIYKVGDRSGVNDASAPQLYSNAASSSYVKTSDIIRSNFYFITDKNDLSSWVDDVGETRGGLLIRIYTTHSRIEDVSVYGCTHGFVLNTTSGGTHTEKNLKGYNIQTLLWLSTSVGVGEYSSGNSDNLLILNTTAQKSYWVGKNVGKEINGMDIILNDCKHDRWFVSKIGGINIIERNIYNHRGHIYVSDSDSFGGSTGINMKTGTLEVGETTGPAIVDGDRTVVVEDMGAGVYTTYGFVDVTYKNFDAHSTTKLSRPFFSLDEDTYKLLVTEGVVTNLGALVSSNLVDAIATSNVTFSKIEAVDVYNGISSNGTLAAIDNNTLSNITFSDITHKVTSPTPDKFARAAYNIKNVDGVNLIRVTGWGNYSPFRMAGSTNIKVLDSRFQIASDSSLAGAINTMKADVDFAANEFDFWVDVPINIQNPPAKLSIHFAKGDDTVKSQCWDFWDEMYITYNIPENTAVYSELPISDKSYDVYVTYANSSMLLSVDGEIGESTLIRNRGGDLSHTDPTSFYRVYNDVYGNLVLRTTSTTLPGGQLSLKVIR